MPLFQQSVVKKYINDLNKTELQAAWQLFVAHFQNAVKQANIRNLKEEEYQEGFVRDLFVSVLNYTLNPQPDYNFVLEKKSVTDATKSDGAILLNHDVIAVIELKDTGTPDLDKVSNQAFGYKHKHKNCTYVITSNFEKLRFYINDATDYEEFDLFALTQQRFALLWLCLQQQNLHSGLPLQIKQQSLLQEENVTKKLYADYSSFKRKLFQNIADQNPQYDKLLLFKKTQKLLDRFLFIFFAEDRLLLPPNSVREILKQWEQLKELDSYVPLYERFKKYFGYLNLGHVGKHYEIFAYNGGLFLKDEVLDNITVDDAILYDGTKMLSNYDFETDVDVNILGHIFEHSLTEIEELQATLEGKAIEKNTTKRKKDGVFYTPRYITKYIVENTVGALCTQQKELLQINEETLAPQKRKDKRKQLLDTIETYRTWLLQLTICDPACGSGAFLNAALEYLKEEHKTIDELKARIFGDAIVYTDIDNSILENNLFGVDINEEAIEIAKLSLWLHTAKKGRKLSNLSNNIKCGNSLIDDATVAGDKAFVWKEEFKTVFDKGGFDVVIGNPPWGAKLDEISKENLSHKYPLIPSKLKDSYLYFMLMILKIVKPNGFYGMITPNTWLLINNADSFRKEILSFNVKEIIDYGDGVFQDAIVESSSIILRVSKSSEEEVKVKKYRDEHEIISQEVNKKIWLEEPLSRIVIELKQLQYSIIKKMESVSHPFSKTSEIIFGIKPYQVGHGTPAQTQEILDKRIYHSDYKIDQEWKPLVTGTEITRYSLHLPNKEYIKYGKWLMYPSNEEKILNKKILLRRTSHDLKAVLDSEKYYPQNSVFIITSELDLDYLISLLNSKLFDFIYKAKCPQVGKVFAEVKPSIVKELPIVDANLNQQQPFSTKAETMLSKNKELNQIAQQFTQLLQAKFATININNKLQSWYSLTEGEFLKELSKQKIKLSLAEQQEWLQYFRDQQTNANIIQYIIHQTDKEIDQMVYALYELTEEEIKIVEAS